MLARKFQTVWLKVSFLPEVTIVIKLSLYKELSTVNSILSPLFLFKSYTGISCFTILGLTVLFRYGGIFLLFVLSYKLKVFGNFALSVDG